MRHAEAGYECTQEEEDAITGDLWSALRTSEVQLVNVSDGDNNPGMWKWEISYSKVRSKSCNATETIIGADGILELKVGNVEVPQVKSALFQAKNDLGKDKKLVEQCIKLSTWREAAFIINYTANGYFALSVDDVIQSGGDSKKFKYAVRLADWLKKYFLECKVGHTELYYDKALRRLYWASMGAPKQTGYYRNSWVYADFMPRYLASITITPPHWWTKDASEIPEENIQLNRLTYTAEDLYDMRGEYTLSKLNKRKKELLQIYHSDKNHRLQEVQPLLDARVREIMTAYDELAEHTVVAQKRQNPTEPEITPANLPHNDLITVDDLLQKTRKPEMVRRRNKKNS
jgi:hypothetical protein